MPMWWLVLTTVMFTVGLVLLTGSMFFLAHFIAETAPLLTEGRQLVQDLGDVTANTAERAQETLDLVEQTTSRALMSAGEAASGVSRQAVGFGSVLAGLFVAGKIAGAFNKRGRGRKSARKRR